MRRVDMTHYFRPVVELHPGVAYSVQPDLCVIAPASDVFEGDIVGHRTGQSLIPVVVMEKVVVPIGKTTNKFFHVRALHDSSLVWRIPQYRENLSVALLMPFDPAKQSNVVTDIECKACKAIQERVN